MSQCTWFASVLHHLCLTQRGQDLCNEAVSSLFSPGYLLTNIFSRQCFCSPRPVVVLGHTATATLWSDRFPSPGGGELFSLLTDVGPATSTQILLHHQYNNTTVTTTFIETLRLMDEYQTSNFNKQFSVGPDTLLRHYELSIFTIIRAQKLNYWVKLSWNHQQFFWWFSEMSTVFSGTASVRWIYFCGLYWVCLLLKPNGRFWFTLAFDVCKDWRMNTRVSFFVEPSCYHVQTHSYIHPFSLGSK